MITAVLDTNILASGIAGFTNPTSIPGALLHAWQERRFTLITSEHIIQETRATLRKPYFVTHVTPQRASRLLAVLRYHAQVTPITVSVSGIATHPEDDLVLAAAVSARATYLVTGDDKLQQLGFYQGVTIHDPALFFGLLEVNAHESDR